MKSQKKSFPKFELGNKIKRYVEQREKDPDADPEVTISEILDLIKESEGPNYPSERFIVLIQIPIEEYSTYCSEYSSRHIVNEVEFGKYEEALEFFKNVRKRIPDAFVTLG